MWQGCHHELRGHPYVLSTCFRLCVLWIILPHQAATGNSGHWSHSSHSTHPLLIRLQSADADRITKPLQGEYLPAQPLKHIKGSWWRSINLGGEKDRCQWRLKPKRKKASSWSGGRGNSKRTFPLLWGPCPLGHPPLLRFSLHPIPHSLLFLFPLPFQCLPPTSTNSMAPCQKMANVT